MERRKERKGRFSIHMTGGNRRRGAKISLKKKKKSFKSLWSKGENKIYPHPILDQERGGN